MLDSFWNLAIDDEDKRVAAAQVLLEELMVGQREHDESRRSKDSHAPLPSPADLSKLPKPKRQELALRKCSPLMIYALRRLVRGLGSGRDGARQGFATALTLLLSQQAEHGHTNSPHVFMEADDVLILIETCLETSSTIKAGVSARKREG